MGENLGIVGRGIWGKGGVRNGADGGNSNIQNEKQKSEKIFIFLTSYGLKVGEGGKI